VLTTNDPLGGASSWHSTQVATSSLTDLSCNSDKACVTVDEDGHTVAGIDVGPILGWLGQLLGPPRHGFHISDLLGQHRYHFSLRGPADGKVTLQWIVASRVVAVTSGHLERSRTSKIRLYLTPAGRRILQVGRRQLVTFSGQFVPDGWTALRMRRTSEIS
jgi:hypothetical protein